MSSSEQEPQEEGSASASEDDLPTLQQAFLKFKQQKKADIKEKKKTKKKKKSSKVKTRKSKDQLREDFLTAAFGYLGVPYGKRFHDESCCKCEGCEESQVQLRYEPLHLDCCALIRRCVKDLKSDFGFQLGPGNQGYQFDTLPQRVESIHELEPGDLVFYEGTYYNPATKRPKHDMVHVEIFTGSGINGEGVIGSREQKKWVKEYDDYRIENSKRWKLIRYHFCKIDTWLDGVCQSFCDEHDWPVRTRGHKKLGPKSIFNVSESGSGEQQNAEDADEVG